MKMYAGGMDWVAAGLNAQCAQMPGEGNSFLVILEISSSFSFDLLTSAVNDCIKEKNLPLNGCWKRAWHLAPYWKYNESSGIIIDRKPLSDFVQDMTEYANTPLPHQHGVSIRLFEAETHSVIAFKFSHLLFDGVGAEYFIRALLTNDKDGEFDRFHGNPSANLNRWGTLFASGQRINRFSRAISSEMKRKNEQTFKSSTHPSGFIVERFDYKQISTCIEAKYGMFSICAALAGVAAKSFSEWKRELHPGVPHEVLLQISVNQRQRNDERSKIFFNQWSLIPTFFPVFLPESDISNWILHAKKQMASAVENSLCRDFENANLPLRILPPSVMGKFVLTRFKRGAGDAMFSFISSDIIPRQWMGNQIENVVHVPTVPISPGLGLFFTAYGNHLNLVISFQNESEISDSAKKLQDIIAKNLESFYE